MYQKSVEANHEGKVTIVWNQLVRTNKTIPNDKPENMIRHNKKGTCMLIDVAIPEDRNVINKDVKILKSSLIKEIQRKWIVPARVIPVILVATANVSKSLRQYLNNTPGKHEIKELQKNSHIWHCTQTAKVIMLKYKTYFTGEITLRAAKIVNTQQLQYYIPLKRGLFQLHNCKYPA
jgi:hypothetical protein